MTRTQWKELFNKIKSSKVSFIAITMFVTFGVALYAGIGWSGIALSDSIDAELERELLHDYEIVFPRGVDDAALDKLAGNLHITTVEGTYSSSEFFDFDGRKLQAKLVSMTEDVDQLYRIEGTLPSAQNEIAVGRSWAEKNGVAIGDTVSFFDDSRIYSLCESEFTVTALAESPAYISVLAPGYESSLTTYTPIDCIMFVPKDAFRSDLTKGYTNVFVRCDELRGRGTLSEDYQSEADALRESLTPQLDDVAGGSSYIVFSRENNGSISMADVIFGMFDTLKVNMALMFIVIGVLVCFSAESRLVYKDIRQIGTTKALGFRRREITRPYLIYAVLAALTGLALGFCLARFVIEPAFLKVLSGTYLITSFEYCLPVKSAAVLAGAEIVLLMLAASAACRRTLKKNAVELLAGPNPPSGRTRFYEDGALWKRLSLLKKCIVNNLFGDPRRVAATLIGVSGCTALVVCALSFQTAISDSFDYQFSELQDYRSIVYFDPSVPGCEEEIASVLEEEDVGYTVLAASVVKLQIPGGGTMVASCNVSDENFYGMVTLQTKDGEHHRLEDGVWISRAFAENYGIEKGGTLHFIDSASVERSAEVAGVYDFYMQCPKIMMSAETYKDICHTDARKNAFFVSASGDKLDAVGQRLSGIDGYFCISDYYKTMKDGFGILIGVSLAIVCIYLLLSVLMAFFVLLDLLVMFVEERKRELITLRINGYPIRDARRYISTDTVFLTVLGIGLGVAAGVLMGRWTVDSMTSDVSCYLNRIDWTACLIGAAFSAVLTFFMTRIALRRIGKFNLSDLNKG